MNKRELLIISICIFLTVIAWLVADIYNATTQDKIKTRVELPSLQKYNISKDLLNKLQQKTE